LFLLPPTIRRFPSPSRSSIGAFSHNLISRSTVSSGLKMLENHRFKIVPGQTLAPASLDLAAVLGPIKAKP